MDCPSIVNQKVCVEAKVTVNPEAEVGDVHAYCVGKPHFEECGKKSCGCTYMVSQMLCVRFSLAISANASAKPAGIVCCEPEVKACCPQNEQEMPCDEEVSYQTIISDDDTACFKPMLFEKTQNETEPYGDAIKNENRPYRKRSNPIMQRGGFCFPPLPCVPCCCPRFGFFQRKSRHRPIF